MESKRQLKAAKIIQQEISIYFQENSFDFRNKIVSVTVVRMSPDLKLAKIYLSIFPPDKSNELYEEINKNVKKIRYKLGKKIRHQFRNIPELDFFMDDSLDYAEKIDKLLR